MPDNYERKEGLNPCDDCMYRGNIDKCVTCKHFNKEKLIRPQYPNQTDGSYRRTND